MSYDQNLAARVRRLLADRTGVEEKNMFGGLTFMVRGHMCCGVANEELMLRLGAERAAKAITRPHARYCDFTGKIMKTMVMVTRPGFERDDDLEGWVAEAVEVAEAQPPKKPSTKS